MSLTRISGERISTTGNVTLYTGRGRLTGILISNDNAAVQDLTFYDGVNIILLIHFHPALAPSISASPKQAASWRVSPSPPA